MIRKYLDWRGPVKIIEITVPILFFLIPSVLTLLPGGIASDLQDTIIQFIVKVLIFFNPSDNVIFDSFIFFLLNYLIFTFTNFILNKFNFDWLLSGGWKHLLDYSALMTIFYFLGYTGLISSTLIGLFICIVIGAAWAIIFLN